MPNPTPNGINGTHSGDLGAYAVDQVQGVEVHAGLASLRSWRCAHFHAPVFSPADRVQAHRRAGDVAGEVFEAIRVVGQDRLRRVHAEAGVFPAQEHLLGFRAEAFGLAQGAQDHAPEQLVEDLAIPPLHTSRIREHRQPERGTRLR